MHSFHPFKHLFTRYINWPVMYLFFIRATVPAKTVTMATGRRANQSISVWNSRVDVITWWVSNKHVCTQRNSSEASWLGFLFLKATCQFMGQDGWQCVCEEDYAGDGIICYGTLAQVHDISDVQVCKPYAFTVHFVIFVMVLWALLYLKRIFVH